MIMSNCLYSFSAKEQFKQIANFEQFFHNLDYTDI